jgi:uncharacterized protein (UPF0303 family)
MLIKTLAALFGTLAALGSHAGQDHDRYRHPVHAASQSTQDRNPSGTMQGRTSNIAAKTQPTSAITGTVDLSVDQNGEVVGMLDISGLAPNSAHRIILSSTTANVKIVFNDITTSPNGQVMGPIRSTQKVQQLPANPIFQLFQRETFHSDGGQSAVIAVARQSTQVVTLQFASVAGQTGTMTPTGTVDLRLDKNEHVLATLHVSGLTPMSKHRIVLSPVAGNAGSAKILFPDVTAGANGQLTGTVTSFGKVQMLPASPYFQLFQGPSRFGDSPQTSIIAIAHQSTQHVVLAFPSTLG